MPITRTAEQPRIRTTMIVLGIVTMVVLWLEYFIVRHHIALGMVSAIISALTAAVALRHSRKKGWVALATIGAAAVILQLLWTTTGQYPLWIASFVTTACLAMAAWVAAWVERRKAPITVGSRLRRGIVRGTGFAAGAVAFMITAGLAVIMINPAPAAETFQTSSGAGNSFEPEAPMETHTVRGTQFTNDVQYGSTYPNSYLDIYIADNDPTVSRPTYVIVHGGGFILGSKSDGDPNASGGDHFALDSEPVIDAGYNVVSVGYALAPQYSYPTPTIQLGEAMRFLAEHGSDYGLDLSRVVLSGGSAGGHIVAQYAAVQTNPDYAAELGIEPTMEPDHIKAVALDSPALIPALAGRTQSPVLAADWIFDLSLRSYFGTSQDLLAQANIVDHVTAQFPPTFVSDGNTGTFPDQAEQLSETLNALGVTNEAYLPPASEAILGHGFMTSASPSTEIYNQKKIAFLSAVLD